MGGRIRQVILYQVIWKQNKTQFHAYILVYTLFKWQWTSQKIFNNVTCSTAYFSLLFVCNMSWRKGDNMKGQRCNIGTKQQGSQECKERNY